jgi:hypothetical protein
MTKRNAIAFLLSWTAVLGGCGGGGGSDDDSGTVYFKIDSATCRGKSTSLMLYVNGSLVGTETVAVGGTSSGYATHSGSNVMSAQENRTGGLVWNPGTYDVPGGGSFTMILTC